MMSGMAPEVAAAAMGAPAVDMTTMRSGGVFLL